MQINNLDVLLSDIPQSGQSRTINISGENGAAFVLQIVSSDGKFYDFVNNTFVNGHIPRCNYKGVISGSTASVRVRFASVVSATTYNIILVADPSTDTTISGNRQAINFSVSQIADTVITLAYNTSNTASYTTSPPSANVVTTISQTSSSDTLIKETAAVTNATTQANGFGLKLDRQPLKTDLVFIATTTLDGTTSSSTTLLVDSTTDIVKGMFLVSGPNLSGTPVVTKVEPNVLISGVEKKRITLDTAQTLNSDGATLTFHARGAEIIESAIGVSLIYIGSASIPTSSAVVGKIVAQAGTATAGSDATLALKPTYGIGAGGEIQAPILPSGLTVSSVTAGSDPINDTGTIEMSSAQDLSDEVDAGAGIAVNFPDFATSIDVKTELIIINPGSTNRTLTLLLDNFITPGAAS